MGFTLWEDGMFMVKESAQEHTPSLVWWVIAIWPVNSVVCCVNLRLTAGVWRMSSMSERGAPSSMKAALWLAWQRIVALIQDSFYYNSAAYLHEKNKQNQTQRGCNKADFFFFLGAFIFRFYFQHVFPRLLNCVYLLTAFYLVLSFGRLKSLKQNKSFLLSVLKLHSSRKEELIRSFYSCAAAPHPPSAHSLETHIWSEFIKKTAPQTTCSSEHMQLSLLLTFRTLSRPHLNKRFMFAWRQEDLTCEETHQTPEQHIAVMPAPWKPREKKELSMCHSNKSFVWPDPWGDQFAVPWFQTFQRGWIEDKGPLAAARGSAMFF